MTLNSNILCFILCLKPTMLYHRAHWSLLPCRINTDRITGYWEMVKNFVFCILTHVRFFPHKQSMSNHKAHCPLSTCKNLGRSYDQFLRKWPKTLFFAFYGIFAGMPKACQIFPHKPSMPNHKAHWPLLTSKILRWSYDQFLRK